MGYCQDVEFLDVEATHLELGQLEQLELQGLGIVQLLAERLVPHQQLAGQQACQQLLLSLWFLEWLSQVSPQQLAFLLLELQPSSQF
jgi:hypothetical protein